MGIRPLAVKLDQTGGSDAKRLQVDENAPIEKKEDKASRWRPEALVEQNTAGSFLNGKGANSILAKDPMDCLQVTVSDCTPPGYAELAAPDVYKDAV